MTNKRINRIKSILENKIFIIITILFVCIFSVISILTHNHFQTFGWDLGFFDQIIWKVSRGDLQAFSTIGYENLLADHFQVVLYFLAPLYWIKNDVRMILLAQSILVSIAAVPLYFLAKEKSRSFIFASCIVLSYFLFLGTQWTILNEFHQAAFIPLWLSIFFLSLHRKNRFGYWIGIIGLLITKEELGFLVAVLGLLTWWKYHLRERGISTFLLGIFSFFFLIYVLMPYLSVKGTYAHFDFGSVGYTPIDVLKKTLSDPLFILRNLVYPSVKISTVFQSLFAFGFLPLFSPVELIVTLSHFATRFIYSGPQFTKWTNVNHHAAPLGILLAVGSISGSIWLVDAIKRKLQIKKSTVIVLLGIYIFGMSMLQNILLHGPVNSILKPQLYTTLPWMQQADNIVKSVPQFSSVAAQNSLVPHISQREKIYLIPDISDAEYLLVDLHDGPNKYSPLTHGEMVQFIESATRSGQFFPFKQEGDAILLKRSST